MPAPAEATPATPFMTESAVPPPPGSFGTQAVPFHRAMRPFNEEDPPPPIAKTLFDAGPKKPRTVERPVANGADHTPTPKWITLPLSTAAQTSAPPTPKETK